MKLYIKYDINVVIKKTLQEQLDKLELNYSIVGLSEVEITGNISIEKMALLDDCLNVYGIEIIQNNKNILIQKIKDVIIEMVYLEENINNSKTSNYLAEKLGLSYGYISNSFMEATYTGCKSKLRTKYVI